MKNISIFCRPMTGGAGDMKRSFIISDRDIYIDLTSITFFGPTMRPEGFFFVLFRKFAYQKSHPFQMQKSGNSKRIKQKA